MSAGATMALLATLPLIGLTDVYSKRLTDQVPPLVLAAGRNFYGAVFIALVSIALLVMAILPAVATGAEPTLPDPDGNYDETPETLAAALERFADAGWLNIVGGCCGTTPAHIAALREAVAGKRPRTIPDIPVRCRLSGLEPLRIHAESLFVNVGERTNVAGSARFRRLIKEGDFESALDFKGKRRAVHGLK